MVDEIKTAELPIMERYDAKVREFVRKKQNSLSVITYEDIAKLYSNEPVADFYLENFVIRHDYFRRKIQEEVCEYTLRCWLLKFNIPQSNMLVNNVLPIAKAICPYSK